MATQQPSSENYVEWTIVQALRTLQAEPGNAKMKQIAAGLLRVTPVVLDRKYEAVLHALLTDPDVDPSAIEHACWSLIAADNRFPKPETDPRDVADWLEHDFFALTLLSEAVVTIIQIEQGVLNPLRNWLLMSGESPEFPRATAALAAQAALNGGAWPFTDVEARALKGAGPIEAAYLPPRPATAPAGQLAWVSPVTRDVAAQYEGWPYPAWKRAMAGRGESLREVIAALGEGAPQDMPEHAAILVAGCGTGHEPVLWARRFPGAQITAIDLSAASLAYARARAAEAGVTNVTFEQRDLHDAGGLGQQFDIVLSSGVLHHLADPEAGWAAIAGVLRPGGVMRVQLYSKAARAALQPALDRIADLTRQPMSDDLLRTVRQWLGNDPSVNRSPDFFSLGGVHDLLLHAHEDSFDVPRIRAAIDRLGLELLRFELPTADRRQRYQAEHPADPNFRDAAAWERIERDDPMAFAGMHDFWCLKPA